MYVYENMCRVVWCVYMYMHTCRVCEMLRAAWYIYVYMHMCRVCVGCI